MAPSSSAKKVAKLASRGKGKKVRFQGGSIFPIAVAAVVVLGLLAIVYGRESRPSDGSGAPTIDDHWHAAFGIYVCDTYQPKIIGTAEETIGTDANGNPIFKNEKYPLYGIHSHGDGVIHYHPSSTRSTGNRAKLGIFLDVYNIKLSDTELTMPDDQGGEKWSTKDFKCDGKDTELKVVVWDKFDRDDFHEVVTDFRNTRIINDGMVFAIAIVPKGTDVPKPDWAAQLPTLGAADSGAVTSTTSTVPGAAPGSTVAGATTVPGSIAPAGDTSAPTTIVAASTTTGG